MNDLWAVIFTQDSGEEGLRSLRIAVALKEDIEHGFVLVHCSPQPVSDAPDARTHINQMPPGTPPGFPVAQFLSEEGSKVDTSFAKGLVADRLGRAGTAIPGYFYR